VFKAALMQEPVACSLFDKIGYWLGVGIASLVNLLDIQLVVVGGGLSATGDLLLHPARLSFREFIFSPAHRQLPQIITACLGAEAGLVGAAILALEMTEAVAAPETDPIQAGQPAKST
jgi:glucokinase